MDGSVGPGPPVGILSPLRPPIPGPQLLRVWGGEGGGEQVEEIGWGTLGRESHRDSQSQPGRRAQPGRLGTAARAGPWLSRDAWVLLGLRTPCLPLRRSRGHEAGWRGRCCLPGLGAGCAWLTQTLAPRKRPWLAPAGSRCPEGFVFSPYLHGLPASCGLWLQTLITQLGRAVSKYSQVVEFLEMVDHGDRDMGAGEKIHGQETEESTWKDKGALWNTEKPHVLQSASVVELVSRMFSLPVINVRLAQLDVLYHARQEPCR
ncbi:uncharacterized protein LOC141499596 [Macrotis lagotis]|uniref:uncharacterized protein LOC141499596 n=1 Tax=Macrotis lagotis TaxID=92651 RepID=UPI003D6854C0